MTKKDPKKNLKPFQPGKSGNPNGRPKLPEDVRKASKVTNEQFILLASEFLLMSRAEIQDRLQSPTASMLELLIGGIVAKAAKDHDHQKADFLLNRTIGKAKDMVVLEQAKPFVITKLDGTQIIMGVAALPKGKDDGTPS